MSFVIQLYREAWKKKPKRQRMLDIGVSIAAPLALLWATVHTLRMYWKNQEPDWIVFLILAVVMVSFGLFAYVCRFLLESTAPEENKKDPAVASVTTHGSRILLTEKESAPEENKENQPSRNVTMLGFATWLFLMGLALTLAEMYDHLRPHIGPLNPDLSRSEFDSPWGDALLAFSAFCMLAEEFSLLNLYDYVQRKLDEAQNMSDDMEIKVNEIKTFRFQTEELYKQTKYYSTETEGMHTAMKNRINPVLITLKWCLAAGVALFLMWHISSEIDRLEKSLQEEISNRDANGNPPPRSGDANASGDANGNPPPRSGDANGNPPPSGDATDPPNRDANGPPKTDPPNGTENSPTQRGVGDTNGRSR